MYTSIRVAAVCVALLLAAAAAMAQEKSETWKKIDLDTPFEIALVTNPSTGFGWQIDKAASTGLERLAIDDLGTSPVPQQSGRPLVGAPVIHTWLITPRRTGTARLVLIYLRGFNKEREPPIKVHIFHIDIAR
jgi:predicted secreted protein